ncbi:MAG: ABC transporter [Deltaproteobacteria bacterium]|nr:ABC transporter [Deltaproteobacteria bacterium]
MIELLAPALVACFLLACILGYFGLHVLMREVIFVDLALAQLAALGATVGHLQSAHGSGIVTYLWSFGFTLGGAAIFALARPARTRLPQEAVIGIVYGVSAALVILVLSKSALDRDEVESMLTGRLLFAGWDEIGAMALLFIAVAALHFRLRGAFLKLSEQARHPEPRSSRDKLLDFIFYASFGVVVTSSVPLTGVLVVFGMLIVPAACAAIFFDGLGRRLLAGWAVGALASAAGVAASAWWDLPTGASVVAALGAAFALALLFALFQSAEG